MEAYVAVVSAAVFGILTPAEPLSKIKPVAPVTLPMVMVLALALVPILTAPVVPESRDNAPEVPELTDKPVPADDDNEDNPVNDDVDDPRDTEVVPMVTELLANAVLGSVNVPDP
jgi:hypothetical protein